MDERLDWYRALSPQDRSWVGMIAQAGISEFVGWYRRPTDPVQIAVDVFGAAPRELTRSISLQQTLDLLRIVVDVIEEQASLHVAPGAHQAVREAVLRFSREVAFAAAQIYARAAESRGAWDARLEALVVDALVRDEPDEDLHSRAAALGWAESGPGRGDGGPRPASDRSRRWSTRCAARPWSWGPTPWSGCRDAGSSSSWAARTTRWCSPRSSPSTSARDRW